MDINLVFKRDFKADFINQVVNDPSVREGAKLEGLTDLSHLITLNNVLLTYESGGFLLLNKGSGTYEVHTMALKEGRGDILRENIEKAMEYMFFQTDCLRLITRAYKDNPASVALSKCYFTEKGETQTYKYYELNYSDWVIENEEARKAGQDFHEVASTNHEEDEIHDCQVGGAYLLLKNGNVGKGVQVYNEWAVLSGYEMITVIGVAPLILQVGKMMLIYHNGILEEICQ